MEVSIDLAMETALNFSKTETFYNSKGKLGLKVSESKKTIRKVIPITDESNFNCLYIINFDPIGFIVVSGHKKDSQIIAYSNSNSFEFDDYNSIPVGVKEWIELRKLKIKKLRNGVSENSSNYNEPVWPTSVPPEGEEETETEIVTEQVGPLLSTQWRQGLGFNDSINDGDLNCPGKAPAGCTAIAVAQIMKHWEYPSSYNWSAMDDNLSSPATCVLIRDVCVAVDMTYSCTGSGASLKDASMALKLNFGYLNDTIVTNYSTSNTSIIVSQIDNSYPILIQGYNQEVTSGHAWVCDGYKRDKIITIHNPGTYYEYETFVYSNNLYMHMNWGWGSLYDAFFLYNDFTPGSSIYNYNNKMVIDIHI